jgi:sugar phosphate isomerase/epimerase
MFKNLNPSALGVAGHQSEIIELALTYGFRAIDLNIVEFATRVKLHGVKYARRLIDSAKTLKVGTFELPLDLDAEEEAYKKELAKVPEYASMAADLGCTRCLAVIAPGSDNRPYHENFELHRRRLSEICGLFDTAKIRLGVGFRAPEEFRKGLAYQFVHDFDALSLLLNMVGAPNLGLLLDVWDLYVAGGSLENVKALNAQQVVAVRLADLPEETKLSEVTEQDRLLPGTTNRIDSVAILQALGEMQYDGPVTPTPDRRAFDSNRRDRVVKMAADSLDRAMRAAGVGEPRPSLVSK